MRNTVTAVVAVAVITAVSVNAGEPSFPIHDPGTEEIVDYEKYGEFIHVGKTTFEYVIRDAAGLARASGEGIDPCLSLRENPDYLKASTDGKLDDADPWRHVKSSDPQLDFFVWNGASEEPGIRLVFVGRALEHGGHLMHALKAYRAAMVLYPDSATWSAGGEFQWSAAEAAWNFTQNLLRQHPELNLRLSQADVTTHLGSGGLVIAVNPGRLERMSGADEAPGGVIEPIDRTHIIAQRGTGLVQCVQYGNRNWEMLVDGEPHIVRGIHFAPTKVGELPWKWNWLWSDENTNGTLDSFEVWVDQNGNNVRDEDEPLTSDYALMKEMGVNTIKIFVTDAELETFNVLAVRKLYNDYGIRVLVGNFLGAYCNGSGASWERGTDYTDRKQRESMKASVSNLVMKLKGEPWVLAWLLGNENNMEMGGEINATRTNASQFPEAYARFVNEVCGMIHELDSEHPVGLGNLLVGMVEYYGRLAPELDYIGINSYIGDEGFGATWQKVSQAMDRPVIITEFGCDSYWTDRGPDEDAQAGYLARNWEDILYNSAGLPGVGNAVGGFVFEWLDEWWKDTKNNFDDPPTHQTTRPIFPMAFPDGFAQEEWFGIMGQGSGEHSPFQRVPKKAYTKLKAMWNGAGEGATSSAVEN